MASERTRSTNLQTPPVPNPVTQRTDRSVVSDLTTPSPPVVLHIGDDVSDAVEEDFETFVEKEIEKDINGGDGGDSDEEGDECFLHLEDSDEESDIEEVVVETKDGGKSKGFVDVDLTDSSGGVIGNVLFREGDVRRTELAAGSLPKDVKIYKPPSDWRVPMTQHERDEPMFEDVDNPGNWPQYCFRPRFKGAGTSRKTKYLQHSLPTGAVPVPINKDGKRVINGWEFFYNGWTNPGTQHRRCATTANMFPKEMEGSLDGNILVKLGLNETRMGKTTETDALFFYQLILPICNPQFSGVKDDPRMSYYHDVERFTNGAKYDSGMGASYGHNWNPVNLKELTNWDGILVRDGVLGGTQGAIHRRWEKDGPCFAPEIANVMTLSRHGDIKRSLKLCNNHEAPKRGQGEYEILSRANSKLI